MPADFPPSSDLQERIEQITDLPAFPEVSKSLLDLLDDDNSGITQLDNIISIDPIISAQIIRYAHAPFFRAYGEVNSVQDAIKLLGYNKALYFSLGLAMGQSFSIPDGGPIGKEELWRHSVYSASLMHELCDCLPAGADINPGLAYLSGLLHDIGFFVLAHYFPAEFNALNSSFKKFPEGSRRNMEMAQLGVRHNIIGAWLMRKWSMPGPLTVAVFEHHNEHYKGEFNLYANLLFICDRLLHRFGISDASSSLVPDNLKQSLGLDDEKLALALEKLMASKDQLDGLINVMLEK